MRPLYELTKKNATFGWGDRRQQAFKTLKARLCSALLLATPTLEGDFMLDDDASSFRAGTILHQYQDGVLRVIGFASRQFNVSERSYCMTRQELVAVKGGFRGPPRCQTLCNMTLKQHNAGVHSNKKRHQLHQIMPFIITRPQISGCEL